MKPADHIAKPGAACRRGRLVRPWRNRIGDAVDVRRLEQAQLPGAAVEDQHLAGGGALHHQPDIDAVFRKQARHHLGTNLRQIDGLADGLIIQPSKHAAQAFDVADAIEMRKRFLYVANDSGPADRRKGRQQAGFGRRRR